MNAVRDVLRALTLANVRYVVVGGVAVVLHGYVRATRDLDLVIDLSPEEVRKAVGVLSNLGLTPTVPIDAMALADAETRRRWIEEKNMIVLQMRDERHDVDLFIDHPIDFEELWAQSRLIAVGDVTVRVASIAHLIAMKQRAGRAEDLLDIEKLRLLADLDARRTQ